MTCVGPLELLGWPDSSTVKTVCSSARSDLSSEPTDCVTFYLTYDKPTIDPEADGDLMDDDGSVVPLLPTPVGWEGGREGVGLGLEAEGEE